MAAWTISISVYNSLDRTLKLEDMRVPWGDEKSRADTIAPGQTGNYCVVAGAGTAYGPELFFTLRDIPPAPEAGAAPKPSYGALNVHVDIPYWKSCNTLDVTTSGMLQAGGYAGLPSGQHDYVSGMTILRK